MRRKQMTVSKDMDASSPKQPSWDSINWELAQQSVRRLQIRIAQAVMKKKYRSVKALQWLLTHSFYAKALAVKRVTENKGKRTPGIDKVVWQSPRQKITAVGTLTRRGYQAKALRRVYIPKKNGTKRPLSIPTMRDRAMQALYMLAISQIAETTADLQSFGFREKRGCADAIEYCFQGLAKWYSPQWILEGDIKSCFDAISHNWLLNNVLTDKKVLKQWLSAGFVWNKNLYPTMSGTPQGGIASPVLANLALDGLEKIVKDATGRRPKVFVIRYADDFIVTADSKELLEQKVKPAIETFLALRGLNLSNEKTTITNINDGFDFLGQTIRKYKGKLLITPSKKSTKLFLRKVRAIIKTHAQVRQSSLISMLNPVIRGWATYHRHVVSTKTFQYIDHCIYLAIWRWCRKRHPNKSATWVRSRYFHTVKMRNWLFGNREQFLSLASSIHIRRHVRIRATANPYNTADQEYLKSRKSRRLSSGYLYSTDG
jgi:RNA-directed DNA polymerase